MTQKMLELFSGSANMSRAFQNQGWKTFTVDIEEKFNPDLSIDILKLSAADILEKFGKPAVIWSSPPANASPSHQSEDIGKPDTPKTKKL